MTLFHWTIGHLVLCTFHTKCTTCANLHIELSRIFLATETLLWVACSDQSPHTPWQTCPYKKSMLCHQPSEFAQLYFPPSLVIFRVILHWENWESIPRRKEVDYCRARYEIRNPSLDMQIVITNYSGAVKQGHLVILLLWELSNEVNVAQIDQCK